MRKKKNYSLPLDKFINYSLYNKETGYYMKKNPFGENGDFTTAPNISRLFSEMIAIWIVGYWQSLGSPEKFNLIELGSGNGELMKIIIESFKSFPQLLKSCNFIIHEKSPLLIKIQKKKLSKHKIIWTSRIDKIKNFPSIFIANEFFDSLAIKQFKKRKNEWFEKFVNLSNLNNSFFFEKKFNIKKLEEKIAFKISSNQNFIEFSETGANYLKQIGKIIKKNQGGLLIFDYGYFEKKMKNTLQSVSNHKFANILENIGNVDITHNINFELFRKIIKNLGGLENCLTTQKNFLIKMGIKERAEIISKNLDFSKKADIFYRLNRLVSEREMGEIFKVMFIKNKSDKFKFGF